MANKLEKVENGATCSHYHVVDDQTSEIVEVLTKADLDEPAESKSDKEWAKEEYAAKGTIIDAEVKVRKG